MECVFHNNPDRSAAIEQSVKISKPIEMYQSFKQSTVKQKHKSKYYCAHK